MVKLSEFLCNNLIKIGSLMAVSEKGNKEWTIQRYCQHWAYKT